MPHILDGKKIAQNLKDKLKIEIENIKIKSNRVPGLAVIQVGNVAASSVYVKAKTKAAKEVGINVIDHHLEESTNQNDLINLINQLKTTTNYEISKKIESKIWKLWSTHPLEDRLTALLEDGSSYVSQNKLETAYETFTKAIELDSNWAEAWNKRATVLYLMGKYEQSQADIDKVLKLEQRHFGALAGQGLVQTALNNYKKAIDSYIEAHKIHPNLKSPLIMIEKLQEQIKKESI